MDFLTSPGLPRYLHLIFNPVPRQNLHTKVPLFENRRRILP